eukprot:11223007-Prorocentrum_lima.AAC.1
MVVSACALSVGKLDRCTAETRSKVWRVWAMSWYAPAWGQASGRPSSNSSSDSSKSSHVLGAP